MAKKGGLDCHLSVDGIDLTGDTGAIDALASPRQTFDKTGLDRKAFERIYGKRDGNMSFTAYFNPALGNSHKTWATLPMTKRHVLAAFGGTIGDWGAAMQALQVDYALTRDTDGDLVGKVDTQGSEATGLDHGRLVTAWPRVDTGAANGAGVDFGTGSTAFGLQAYLHVIAFTGTDATVKLQESSDNGSGDAFADVVGGGFTAVTAIGAQRIATSNTQTVERYLRVATTTSGGFSSMSFVVMVLRNEVALA